MVNIAICDDRRSNQRSVDPASSSLTKNRSNDGTSSHCLQTLAEFYVNILMRDEIGSRLKESNGRIRMTKDDANIFVSVLLGNIRQHLLSFVLVGLEYDSLKKK